MSSPERSTTTDATHGLQFRSRRPARQRFLGCGIVLRVNKRLVLGLLALLIGAAAAATPDGLVLGIPLLVVGCYLLVFPLLATRRTR